MHIYAYTYTYPCQIPRVDNNAWHRTEDSYILFVEGMRNFPLKILSSHGTSPLSSCVFYPIIICKYQTSPHLTQAGEMQSLREHFSPRILPKVKGWKRNPHGGNTVRAGGRRPSRTSVPPSPTSTHVRLLGSLPLLPISSFVIWKMRLHSTSFIFFTTFTWSVQPQPRGNQAGKGWSFLGDIQREPQIHRQEFLFFYHHHTVFVALSILTVTHLS